MGRRKAGKNMAGLRQFAPLAQGMTGTRTRQRTVSGRSEGGQGMVGRLWRAALRAVLVSLTVATPSMMLPGISQDTAQVVVLLAIVAGILTLFEYGATSPSLVEFRDAPPFNRIRFVSLFVSLAALSIILRGEQDPSTIALLFWSIGDRIAMLLDFPYSPVRLMVLMLPDSADPATVDRVRIAAGLSYLISIAALGVFWATIRITGWPRRRSGFNVWINLPTFDPTAGGDVVVRLNRDAQINLVLGFLLPFIIPAVVKLASNLFEPVQLSDPHTLIWTMTAWAFLPAGLLMRGMALLRVAQLINQQRQRAYAEASQSLQPV